MMLSRSNFPRVVCLCGSTRFKTAWERANLRETLEGKIVLSVAVFMHADNVSLTYEEKELLDSIHLFKIEMADEVLVIDVDEYVGESTKREIEYAEQLGKPVRYLSKESKNRNHG